jgi:hypothetical protein
VLILQRQSVIRSLRKLDALLVVSVTLLFTAAPPSSPQRSGWRSERNRRFGCAGLLQAVSSSCAVFDLLRDLSRPGLVRRAVFSGRLGPWSALLPGSRARCTLAAGKSHARWGSFDATVGLLSVAVWLLAAAALLSWYLLLRNNNSEPITDFNRATVLAYRHRR